MRRFLSLVLLFFVVGNFSLLVAAEDLSLSEVYNRTGAQLGETEFQAWLRLNENFNEISVDKLLAQITTEFGYEVKGSIQTSSFQENFQQAFVLVDFFEAEGWLTVQRMENLTFSNQVETFLGLRALRQGPWPDLALYRERVTSDFLKYGTYVDLQFFTTLIGTIPGEVSASNRGRILEDIQAIAEADIVESYHQDNLYSISLLTQELPDLQRIGEKKMNLHLALRYNQFEDRTFVYLGTPIIAPDY